MAREVCESYLCAKYYSRALAGVHCTRVDTEEQEEEEDDEETTLTRTFCVKGGGKLPPIWVKGNKSPTWTNENVTIPKATGVTISNVWSSEPADGVQHSQLPASVQCF